MALIALAVTLVRGALRRQRDSFYSDSRGELRCDYRVAVVR